MKSGDYFYTTIAMKLFKNVLKMQTLINTFNQLPLYFLGFIIPVVIIAAVVISNTSTAEAIAEALGIELIEKDKK